MFGSPRLAWLWLVARIWVGWIWLDAGRGMLGDARWMNGGTLHDAWAVALATGGIRPPARWTIESLLGAGWETWLAPTLAVGLTLVGIAILLGLLTGPAALIGLGLAATPGLAGGIGADPFVALLAVGLVLAWRCAGWFGLDRWVLPLIVNQQQIAHRQRRPEHPGRLILETDPSGLGSASGRTSQ